MMGELLRVKSGVPAQHAHTTETMTDSGDIPLTSGTIVLEDAAAVIAATIPATLVKPGNEWLIWHGTGTQAHTVTLPAGVTWDGTNNTATLNALDESLLVRVISSTRLHIIVNNGAVALSDV